MAPAAYVAEDGLNWHQCKGRPSVLWRLDAPEKDARAVSCSLFCSLNTSIAVQIHVQSFYNLLHLPTKFHTLQFRLNHW